MLIKNLPDNSIYLTQMKDLVDRIVKVLEPRKDVTEVGSPKSIDIFEPPKPGDSRSNVRLARAGFGAVAHEVGTMRTGSSRNARVVDENLQVDG